MNWKNIILGIIFSFFGALTIGDAPYVIAGYGLSTFCLLVIAYTFDPTDAYIAFIVGNSLGLFLGLYTQSALMLVIIGAMVFRIVQAVILIELKKKYDLIASSLISIITLTIVATLIGVYFYGGDGLFTSMTIFDVLYIFPAYLIYYIKNSDKVDEQHKIIGYVLTISSTIAMFLSASTFLLPIPLVVGLVVLIAFVIVIWKLDLSSLKLKPMHTWIVSIVIVVVFALTFVISGPAAQYAITTNVYPLTIPSLTVSQWQQTNHNSTLCRQGNDAGKGSEQNGVWSPSRLRVINTCVTMTGHITIINNDTGTTIDGDFTFDVTPDSGYTYMLSIGSYAIQGGTIHVEVVPSDQSTVLSGLNLKPGAHVRVTGAWVLDTNHGWYSEIHPAWNIQIIP